MGERHLGLLAKTTAQYSIAAVKEGGRVLRPKWRQRHGVGRHLTWRGAAPGGGGAELGRGASWGKAQGERGQETSHEALSPFSSLFQGVFTDVSILIIASILHIVLKCPTVGPAICFPSSV